MQYASSKRLRIENSIQMFPENRPHESVEQRGILLLKDQHMLRLPSDMTGKIYRLFDSYHITETIQRQILEWVERDLCIRPVSEQAGLARSEAAT